jgi:uncharacterized protein with HEPN domain
MSEIRLDTLLNQIRRVSADASSFVEGMTKDEFLADKRTQNAVIMSLMVVGEVVTKIIDRFPGFVAEHEQIPWSSVRGMRNRIAHGYFDLNLVAVWVTVQESLPEFLEKLPTISPSEFKSNESN